MTLHIKHGESIDRNDALRHAYRMLQSANTVAASTQLFPDEKKTVLDYRVRLAYAWMDLAEKIG